MGGFSAFHWFVVNAILFVVPAVFILRRVGHSGWWAIVAVLPGAIIIGLWVFAFIPWPAVDAKPN